MLMDYLRIYTVTCITVYSPKSTENASNTKYLSFPNNKQKTTAVKHQIVIESVLLLLLFPLPE